MNVPIKEKPSAYSALADWFEYLNDDCGYEEWSQYLIQTLRECSKDFCFGLDIGCGSGYFTRELQRCGYFMTGMDVSREMLVKAESLSFKEGLKIPFIQADVTTFRFPQKADFAVAVNDCFNYVKKDKLASAFKRVYAALKRGGYFLFDISSEDKLFNKVSSSVSVDDRDDVTYLTLNSRRGDVVTMDVTLFIRRKNDLFQRFDEQHLLYIYTIEEIERGLKEAGFFIVKEEGYLGAPIEGSDRIEFVCRKE